MPVAPPVWNVWRLEYTSSVYTHIHTLKGSEVGEASYLGSVPFSAERQRVWVGS